MRVLMLNSGSSTLKFFQGEFPSTTESPPLHSGESSLRRLVDRIGGAATLTPKADGMREAPRKRQVLDHRQAVQWVLERLGRAGIDAVGHRVVHGGERSRESVRIDDAVVAEIERLNELAPLRNPACLACRACRTMCGISWRPSSSERRASVSLPRSAASASNDVRV